MDVWCVCGGKRLMEEERSGLHFKIALKCVDQIYHSLSILRVVGDDMSPAQQALASHLVAACPRILLRCPLDTSYLP